MNIFANTLCAWRGHPEFERRPGLDVLYACGEDGAFAWTCVRCGAKVLVDSTSNPNTFSQDQLKKLVAEAKRDTGILIGSVLSALLLLLGCEKDDQVQMSWPPVPEATSYIVYWGATTNYTGSNHVTQPRVLIPKFKPKTYIKVVSVNGQGESAPAYLTYPK